jgi:hypothetical protein
MTASALKQIVLDECNRVCVAEVEGARRKRRVRTRAALELGADRRRVACEYTGACKRAERCWDRAVLTASLVERSLSFVRVQGVQTISRRLLAHLIPEKRLR